MTSRTQARCGTLGVWLWLACAIGNASGADRIILRNLEVITTRTVTSFDLDGVALDNGDTLRWDEIEKANVAKGQAEFDALLAEVGPDLYRIRQRLNVGDYAGLRPHAEALWPKYQQRRTNTAYIVFQSLMWSRLVNGQREEAVEPYLACVECLRKTPMSVPGDRRLRWDSATAMSDELVPLWFRPDAAKEVLPRVGAIISTMEKPWPPGARIYYATLAITAGERDRAAAALAELGSGEGIDEWHVLMEMQQEVQQGTMGTASHKVQAEWSNYEGPSRIVAHFWLGRALSNADNPEARQKALLHLLRLPALYGDEHPEVGAAGLYYAMQTLTAANDAPGAVAVRNELLQQYSQTTFAEKVRENSTNP